MDPRTGARPHSLSAHQRVIQSLIDANLLRLRKDPQEDESQFEATGARKRAGVRLPRKYSLSISWGYEMHSIEVTPKIWAAIVAGEDLSLKSRGWYEGKSFWIQWGFNAGDVQGLYVTYGDDGGTGYEGNLYDLHIDEVA